MHNQNSNNDLKNQGKKSFKVKDKLWMVRAGENGVKFDIFKDNKFVSIGWDLGDLSGKTSDEIKSLCEIKYSNETPGSISSYSSMINTFVNEIKVGDYIISSSDNKERKHIIGKCISDYYYSDKKDTDENNFRYKNCRDVEWLCSIRWDEINKSPNGLKPNHSVFEIKSLKNEIFKLFKPISFSSEEKRNLIYFGAPGTGKSYELNENKKELLKNYENNYERVTFHPDYTYANFVGTYKPFPVNYVDENGKEIHEITYKYVPGPFMRTLVRALKNPSEPFLLVIEEINRANVAAVFGDVFQLLDRDKETNNSEYPINASEDMKNYLKTEVKSNCYIKSLLGEDFDRIIIPQNMFIWATMNSADQGVFPMDTAFKRRWDFEYIGIDDKETKIKNLKVNLNNEEIYWNNLRRAINHKLSSLGINEDKLMGPFFAFKGIDGNLIPEVEFKEIFLNKIVMYLFEDAARSKRDVLFKINDENTNITFSQIRNSFNGKKGIRIFSDDVIEEIFNKKYE